MPRLLSLAFFLLLATEAVAQPTQWRADTPLIGSGPRVSVSIPLNRRPARTGLSRRAWLELGAVALTGVGHLAFSELDASAAFIPLAMGGWGGYVGYRAYKEPTFLRDIGLTREGLGPAFRDASLIAAGSIAIMAGIGVAQGSLRLHQDMIPLLLLYPAWGLVQQTLVQGFVAGNLSRSPQLDRLTVCRRADLGARLLVRPPAQSGVGRRYARHGARVHAALPTPPQPVAAWSLSRLARRVLLLLGARPQPVEAPGGVKPRSEVNAAAQAPCAGLLRLQPRGLLWQSRLACCASPGS